MEDPYQGTSPITITITIILLILTLKGASKGLLTEEQLADERNRDKSDDANLFYLEALASRPDATVPTFSSIGSCFLTWTR